MAVIAYHVRAISAFHLHVPETIIEGDIVSKIFSVGHLGVELFFIVSGFILSLPFARSWLNDGAPVSLSAYYFRRLTRIEPPYVIHLIFLFLLCAAVLRFQPAHRDLFHDAGWFAYSGKHIMASLVYSNGFIYGTHPYPNEVLWSLEVEVQFYLLAPLLARVFKIRRAGLRRGLLCCAIVLGPLVAAQISTWPGCAYVAGFSLIGNLQFFLVGFLLADWQATTGSRPARTFFWDFLFIAAVIILVWCRNSDWINWSLSILLGICAVAAFKGRLTHFMLGHPWITTIGGMCYTIYMYHILMISMLIRPMEHFQMHQFGLNLVFYLLVMSLIIIPVCAVLFAWFERPFMQRDWPRKFLKKFHFYFGAARTANNAQ